MRLAHSRRHRAAAFTLVVTGLLGTPVDAQPARSFYHLRPIDTLANEFLQEAWLGSETVQALVETLEASDVFVQIEARAQEAFRGHLRFMSGSPVCRWVRITVSIPGKRPNLLAALAHELQHAVEIAEASDALDQASAEALFQRIGFRRDEAQFETQAALAVEEQVKRELARSGIVR